MILEKNKKLEFNIENYIITLNNKIKNNEDILFQIQLPTIDNIKLNIKKGYNFPLIVFVNYFLTFGILHEFLQIYIKLDLDIFNYFTKNVLNKKEKSINDISKNILEKNNISIKNAFLFDFSFKNFFIDSIDINNFKSGSEIKNITNLYNCDNIKMNILEIFLKKNITNKSIFLIKMSSIISNISFDFLKILSYIFNNVVIFKSINDSFFKDSFHILCKDLNILKYNNIKKEILKYIDDNDLNIKNLNKINIKALLDINFNNKSCDFSKTINEFNLHLQALIFSFMDNLQSNLKNDIKKSYRNKEKWKFLDYYNYNIKN